MSKAYEGQDLNKLAQQAENDLNSYTAKTGQTASISSTCLPYQQSMDRFEIRR